MADTDLYPTPYRLGLLRDVADGRVRDDPDCVPMLDLGDGESVRVANAVWEMRRAGWVELPPGTDEPAERWTWRLTDAGRTVLEAGAS
jgi:hypothetical protein